MAAREDRASWATLGPQRSISKEATPATWSGSRSSWPSLRSTWGASEPARAGSPNTRDSTNRHQYCVGRRFLKDPSLPRVLSLVERTLEPELHRGQRRPQSVYHPAPQGRNQAARIDDSSVGLRTHRAKEEEERGSARHV